MPNYEGVKRPLRKNPKKLWGALLFLYLFSSACSRIGYFGIDRADNRSPFNANPTAGVATRLSIQGTASTQVGTCSAFLIFPVDVNGLLTSQFSTFAQYNLVSDGSAQLFSDPACANTTSFVLADPSGKGTFYVLNQRKENVVLNAATDTSTLAGSKAVSFTAASAVAYDLIVPTSATSQSCVQGTLRALDTFGNTSSQHVLLTANLSDSTPAVVGVVPVSFYSDSACLNVVGSVNLPSGSESAPFYFQSATLGTRTFSVTSSGISSDTATIDFLSGASPRIGLTGPSSNILANSCQTVRVESQRNDASPLIVTGVPLMVDVALMSGISSALYSDSNCSVALGSTVTIPVNGYFAYLYSKTTQAPQVVTVQGSASGYLAAVSNINVQPVSAARADLSVTPTSIEAGRCGVGTVSLLDSFGNPAYVSANTSVNLSAGAGTSNSTQTDFFTSLDCSGSAISSVLIPQCSGLGSCANTINFSFRPKLVGLASLSVSSTNLIGSSVHVPVVNPTGLPVQLVLTRVSPTLMAGACIEYKLETKDTFGNYLDVSPALTLNASAMSASTLASVYSDSVCNSNVSSVTVSNGTHEQHFFIKDLRAEQVNLSITSGSLSASDSVTLSPGVVTKLVWNNVPASASATLCAGPLTISETDANDNVTVGPVLFNLSATYGVRYFADSQCFNEINSSFINNGGSVSAGFYVAGPNVGSATLTATPVAPSSVTSSAIANLNLSVAPSLHVALSCSATDFSVNTCSNIPAGFCMPVYAASLDSANNRFIPSIVSIGVSLSSSSLNAGNIFSDSTCTTLLSGNSVSITPNLNPASFFIRNTVAENFNINAVSTVGPSTSLGVTVVPSVASRLRVLSTPGANSFLTNQCVGPYSLSMEDAFGNSATQSSSSTVSFLSSSLNGLGFPSTLGFYSDSACSNSTVTVPANSSSTSFYLRSGTAGNLSITPSGSGLSPANSRVVQITESAQLRFLVGGTNATSINFQNVVLGSTSPSVTAELKNVSLGEAAIVDTLSLSGSGFSRLSNSTCPTVVPFTLNSGSSCHLVLAFSPTVLGSVTGSVSVGYHGALGSPAQSSALALTGTGVNAPFVSPYLSLSAIDFGTVTVGLSQSLSAVLRNPNPYAVTITGVTSPTAPFTQSLQSPCGNSFPFSLAANGSCNIQVNFSPTSAVFSASSLRVSFTNPETNATTQTGTLSLTGVGVAAQTQAQIQLELSSFDYGYVQLGGFHGRYILVTNVGDKTATNLSVVLGSQASQYGFSANLGTCGTSLAGHASCWIDTRFQPRYYGRVTSTLNVRYNNDTSSVLSSTISLIGTGY